VLLYLFDERPIWNFGPGVSCEQIFHSVKSYSRCREYFRQILANEFEQAGVRGIAQANIVVSQQMLIFRLFSKRRI